MCSGVFQSCKDEPPPEITIVLPETINLPDLKDADGIVAATREVSFIKQSGFGIVKTVGEATAQFRDLSDPSKFLNVGAVTVNNTYLNFQSDSTYLYNVDLTNSIGTIFSSDIEWEIEGENGYPEIRKTISGWPDVREIISPSAINSNASYELATTEVNFADTTIFQIAGPKGTIYAQKSGQATSHTFSSEDLKTVGTGLGIMQISAYRLRDTLADDRKIYFIMGNAYFETVDIK